MEGINELFLKKLSEIETALKTDQGSAQVKINEVKLWLCNNRSLQEHRMAFAFFKWLYESYGDQYSSLDDFIDGLKHSIGHCDRKVKTTHIDIDCPECGYKLKQPMRFEKFKPKSFTFSKCGEKQFNKLFQMIQELALSRWGVVFSDWKEHHIGGVN